MSRFAQGRWSRILIWTGAALAWGTALIASRQQPTATSDPEPGPDTTQVATASSRPSIPRPPDTGLVVIRYTPVEAPVPVVQTVVVNRQVAASVVASSPAPVSEGS